MDAQIGWVVLVSIIIVIFTMIIFWALWLRKGHYEMPSILRTQPAATVETPRGSPERVARTITNNPPAVGAGGGNTPSPNREQTAVKKHEMERNLFKFTKKMGSYLFLADRNIILRDLGLEQMLYVIFLRRMIIFFLCVGTVLTILIFVWARLTTSNGKLILYRILGSRDITLTNLDFNTFVACGFTVVFTMFLMSLRKHMVVRLCDMIVATEDKKS